MKNKYLNLKNALISATVAVFTGVLLLGVTVALGEAPTYDPPGAGVSPTFSGLNIEGSTVLGIVAEPGSVFVEGGDLTIRGDIINDILDLVINDNLTVKGSVSIGNFGQPKDLSISGNIGNVKDIYLGNNILFSDAGDGKAGSIQTWAGGEAINNNNRTVAGSVFIDDPLEVNGNTTVIGDIDVTGAVSNSAGDFKIADTLNLEGKLFNANNSVNNGWVFIDDVLKVNNRAIFQTGGVEANDGLTVSGSPLVVNSELQAKGDLKVTGKITATSFGTYVKVNGSYFPLTVAGATRDTSVACGAGKYIVSCGYEQWFAAGGYAILKLYSEPASNSCILVAKNTTAGDNYIRPVALCLDPSQ